MSSQLGSGAVTLPADYAGEHVRLGYAATEHGNQGDTVTIGIELATAATTRRGLYVGVTRGREENIICVVTEHGDLDEARDILEGILAVDRVDVPAISQRRLLAATDQQPDQRRPVLQPRCQIPSWFDQLRADIGAEYTHAHAAAIGHDQQLAELRRRLAQAETELAAAERELDRYQPALDAAHHAVTEAYEQRWDANARASNTKGRHRRAARHQLAQAEHTHNIAVAKQNELEAAAAPARAAYIEADDHVHSIRSSLSTTITLHRWSSPADRTERLHHTLVALDNWRDWAHGTPSDPHRLADTVHTLTGERGTSHGAACATLANTVLEWADHFEPDLIPTLTPPLTPPLPSLGIELDF